MFTLFAQVHIKLNMETMTVRSFEERILKGALNMVAPDAEIDGKGVILLSSEEVFVLFFGEHHLTFMNMVLSTG